MTVIDLGQVQHLPRLKTCQTFLFSTWKQSGRARWCRSATELQRHILELHVDVQSWKSKCINQQPPVSGVGASTAPGATDNAELALRTRFNRFHPSPKKSLNAKPHLPSRANSSPSPLHSSAPCFLINVEIVRIQLSEIPHFYFFGTHQTLRVLFEITYRAFARNSLSLEKREREKREIISSLKYTAYISDV